MEFQDLEERTVRISFSAEMMDVYDIDREIIEEKAEVLENSVNGVVFVTKEKFGGIRVDVLYARNAERDIISRSLEGLQSEIIRNGQGKKEYWD